jgi:small ligand-binding sensory domain FIST
VERAQRHARERRPDEGDRRPLLDLALLFVSPHHRGGYEDVLTRVHDRLGPRTLLGCTAAGVIGGGQEVEQRPAIALVGASLPGVALRTFHVEDEDLPTPDAGPAAWIGAAPSPTPNLIVLADPSTMDPRELLQGIDFAYPGSVTVGGLASGRRADPLFLDRGLVTGGAVGVALQGDIVVDTVVAQGCRAIGEAMTVTRCHHNIIEAVDDKPPLEVLGELFEELPERDKELLQTSLHIGVASTGLLGEDRPHDWLIRNVIGADPQRGALAVGALLRPGQRVRFHLRDAQAAGDDLESLLGRYASSPPGTAPRGALLFSCTGRGRTLYGRGNHDSDALGRHLGATLPVGGFFCGGEIGPIGGATHLHGYTSAFAIFREASAVKA